MAVQNLTRFVHLTQVAFFGIFDSHNGDAVAKQLQKNLFNNIVNEGGVWSDPAGATRDAYLLTDRHILDSTEKGGSTAVTAMVCELGGRLIVANLGDSRAVLCKNGKAELVSVKHDPTRPVEKANIETRGGHVTRFPGNTIYKDFKEIFSAVEVRISNILYHLVLVKFMSCHLILSFADIYVK